MGSEAYPNKAMTFEQLKRKDEALQTSARRMLERMQTIIETLDQQSALLACTKERLNAVE
jgi:proline dehydrogenase